VMPTSPAIDKGKEDIFTTAEAKWHI
jgi:hypothetical protein